MSDKNFKKIKNTIIAGASSGIMAGMLLVGGINTTFAESMDGARSYQIEQSNPRGVFISGVKEAVKTKSSGEKKQKQKGWRKNISH